MEQLKIIFFALTSFFAIEGGMIAADKTTVTINPESKQIDIIQEGLFTVIQSEKDSIAIVEQWDKILHLVESNTAWTNKLDSFPLKKINISSVKNRIQPHLTLTYSKEEDLRAFGIWFDADKNQFSMNNNTQFNLKTNEGELWGELLDNYWRFKGTGTFSFTLEPFLSIPENYKMSKKTLEELVKK